MCADELLLRLADPSSIAALTYLSRDSRNSPFAAEAAAFPANRGRAEEIITFAPDLVLASTFTTPATLSMLHRLGVKLIVLDTPSTFDAIAAQMREVAETLGRPQIGEQEAKFMLEQLAKLKEELPLPPATALVLQANNIAVGAGTLIDSILTEAGLINAAAQAGINGYGRISLEMILNRPPDVLIIETDQNSAPALATELLQHPALTELAKRGTMHVISVPSQLWICAGPSATEAVAYLRKKLQKQKTSSEKIP